MTTASDIHADLITPLGAYMRLRAGTPAGFLLESVEKGRLGRHSLVGTGARLVDLRRGRARSRGRAAVVGYLGYDHVAALEPTVPLPDTGPSLPGEPLRRRRHARALRPRGERGRGAGRRPGVGLGAAGGGRRGRAPGDGGRARPDAALPRPGGLRGTASGPRRSTSGRATLSRSSSRSGRSVRPASRRSLSTARSAASTLRPTTSCSSWTASRSSAPRRRRSSSWKARARPSTRSPGTTTPGEGDAEHLLASEKDKAEHVMLVDLGRNDLSRVCEPGSVRVVRFLEAERYSHVTHLVSEVAGELAPGARPSTSSVPASPQARSRARPRSARCRSSRSSRATGAARTRARSATRCRTVRWTPASRSAQ